MSTITGTIFDIQRFSIHDGPGIRTTVFFKGCPLNCAWCHNPESIARAPQLSFMPDRCIGCGYCFKACPNNAHHMFGDMHDLDRGQCMACGKCARECYAGALELVGRQATANEVMEEVLRDLPFYQTSDGGLTLSGGEPTMQTDFALALLALAKKSSLHCAVETCGFCAWENLERMLPHVDLFLFAYKETDPKRHKHYTGVPLEPILENLFRLDRAGVNFRLRCPIIPGVNDREEHFQNIGKIAGSMSNLEGVEIMPYHPLGTSKIARFGMRRDFSAPVPEPDTVESWKETLRKMGVGVL